MVVFTLFDGRKGPNDILVKVDAYGEVMTFAQWLFLAKCFLDSEASYYPVENGFIGKAMLMNAFNEISQGVPLDRVLRRYKLSKKGLVIQDKRKRKNALEKNSGVKVELNHNSPFFKKPELKRTLNEK